MFAEEHSRYALLSQGNSSNSTLRFDKRSAILVAILIAPVLIFCASYMILFGIYEKLVYPSTKVANEDVSLQGLHRAIVYNTFTKDKNITGDIHLNSHHGIEVQELKLVCYYNFPGTEDSLQIDDLDPFLCTHINVAFVEVVNNSLYLNAQQEKNLAKLIKLKDTNGNLKILLSVGGAGGNEGFPQMVYNHANRKSFIRSILHYVKAFKVDGVDLDWEFPNEEPGQDKHQRMHFTQLLEEMRHTINRQQEYRFLVTVAVAAPTNVVENSYDVLYMNEYVDFVNLMSYDYHFYTRVTPFTGINAPLYASDAEKFHLATMNINYSANYWNSLGMDRGKIVVGLPMYGHTFKLANNRNKGLYAPSLGYGKLGSNGFADYPQICRFLSTNQISPVFDMETKSPYAAKSKEWISFDDSESLTYKAEFVRDNNFGGVMVYSLNSDDFGGLCEAGRFPLIKSVKRVVGGGVK